MNEFVCSGSMPNHKYIYVDRSFISDGVGFEEAIWFGLHSHPGRMWGCHLLLESGAFYRNVPPHAISFTKNQNNQWRPGDSQIWDCYGRKFSLLEYKYLYGLRVKLKSGIGGKYLFTAIPYDEGFSEFPGQSKEFMFIHNDLDRLSIVPTNELLFVDKSFTEDSGWPRLKLNDKIYSCE